MQLPKELKKHAEIVIIAQRYKKLFHSTKLETEQKWESVSGDLHNAYLFAECALMDVHSRILIKADAFSNENIQATTLHTSYMRGMELTIYALKTGRYSQAHNLIKQEIETLAALLEHSHKLRKDGKTPNVMHLPEPIRKMYGFMNDVAHVSKLKSHLNSLIIETENGRTEISTTPKFYHQMASSLFALHIGITIDFSKEIIKLFSPQKPEVEITASVDFLDKASTALNAYLNRKK